MSTQTHIGSNHTINIVIPVFRNLTVTRRCLESVLASELPPNTVITIINDSSPEPELSEYCHNLAEQGQVQLSINEVNKGFVASANRGFSTHPDADIVLLNSDTEVANDWLCRLKACAYRDESIGTVTPFSNNAAICSYPLFLEPNAIPKLWDTVQLDKIFQSANQNCYAEIPTAVGFCMYIKRQCLKEVGDFDEESFGKGYGEECDFSMRALKKGWINVVAADVFVFHEGAVSFAEESNRRKEQADLLMRNLHPSYDELITQFINIDPLSRFRDNVDSLRLHQKPGDALNILQESVQIQSALKKRAADIYGVFQSERKALKKSLEKSVWLEEELEERINLCDRQQREITGLADQNRNFGLENETLNKLLLETREDFSKTDNALNKVQQDLAQSIKRLAQMSVEFNQIKQSRSWRYTAWIRRIAGSL